MATRESPWEGAPTSPLPAAAYLEQQEDYPDWPGTSGAGRAGRSRRGRRFVRRSLVVIMGLVLVATLAVGGLLLVTPSVSDAQARARALDLAHQVPYPGPPVPAKFAAALVATEDHRFYSEPGIDPFGVARYLVGKITGRPDQGGATLYQQLAKLLYTTGRSGVMVEAEQVGLGIKLSFAYPRAQILQMYAAVVYFGHGYYGLAAASCGYFGTTPAGLSWSQAALLAGLVQAPSADDPVVHLAAARARQAHVLGRLVATGKLTQAQASSVYQQQLQLVGGPPGACATR